MPLTPSQRTTRSGSNGSNINLTDIKNLIESSREEILKSVKSEMAKYNEMMQSVLTKVEEITQENSFLTSKVKDLETQVEFLSQKQVCVYDGFTTEDVYRELEERQRRRKFVIVSGLPEPVTGSLEERMQEEKRSVTALASKIGVRDIRVENLSRLGAPNSRRPRLLRFKCDIDIKISLLRASKHLRKVPEYEKVFINPDLTRKQRDRERDLRSNLAVRRRAGENVVLRGGRIVEAAPLFSQGVANVKNFH